MAGEGASIQNVRPFGHSACTVRPPPGAVGGSHYLHWRGRGAWNRWSSAIRPGAPATAPPRAEVGIGIRGRPGFRRTGPPRPRWRRGL